MNITRDERNGSIVAIVDEKAYEMKNTQDALDLIADIKYLHNSNKIVISEKSLPEGFFELKTGIAGEILQKYTNYMIKIAIVGEFEKYESKSLKDFIRECNKGKCIFFCKDLTDALDRLHNN